MSHVMSIDYLQLQWGEGKIKNKINYSITQKLYYYLHQAALCAFILYGEHM